MANRRLLSSIAISLDVARSVRGISKFASGGSNSKQPGDIYLHLRSTLGERRYTKLCEDVNLALEEIHYCQSGLGILRINAKGDENGQETESPAQGLQTRQMKDLINHDYLVLKLRPGDPAAAEVHIKAEKALDGIHIQYVLSSDVSKEFYKGVHCFTVACRRKRIRLQAVVAILKEEDPDYSLLYANCWYYAQNTAKRLVKACIKSPGISSAEKARLQEEHDNLEVNLVHQHFLNVAQSLLKKIATTQPNLRKVATFLLHYVTPNPSRVSTSAVPLELSLLPRAANALGILNFCVGPMDRSPQVQELSSSPTDQPKSSEEVLNYSRSMDLFFSEPANPEDRLNSFRASSSSGWLGSSPRVAPELSTANLAGSRKLCLIIVFLDGLFFSFFTSCKNFKFLCENLKLL